MFRAYAPQNVIGDFTENNQFFAGDDPEYKDGKLQIIRGANRSPFARMEIRDGKHYFQIFESDGQWHTYPVDYTIGSKWQQAYATKLANGQIHVFPIQYNALEKQWLNYWKVIDSPGSARADLPRWEKLDATTSYQADCAVCHTSQLRNVKGGGFEPDNLEFRETGINCEMCHGPSARHVASMNTGEEYKKGPLDPPVDFKKINNRDFVSVCAQCHMQSAIRTPGTARRTELFHHRHVLSARSDDSVRRIFAQRFLQRRPLPADHFHRRSARAFEMLPESGRQLRNVPQSAYARRSRQTEPR